MRLLFLTLLVFKILSFPCQSQVWEKLTTESNYSAEDFEIDSFGNAYLLIKGYDQIYSFNIKGPRIDLVELPRVADLPFVPATDDLKLQLDTNNHLLVLYAKGGTYFPLRYAENKFVPDVESGTKNIFCYPGIVSFNTHSEFYINMLSSVFRYKTKWSYSDWVEVFTVPKRDGLIRQIYTYNDTSNFAVVDYNSFFGIYKFNTKDKSYITVAEVNNFYPDLTKVKIFRNGLIFIPTTRGLYKISDGGRLFEKCLIDSSMGFDAPVEWIGSSIEEKILIAKLGKSFYVSEDMGISWNRSGIFNTNFPEGTLVKLKIIDSVTALCQVYSDCFDDKKLFYISNYTNGWKSIDPILFNWHYSELKHHPSGRLYALRDFCNIYYRDENIWRPLKNKDEYVNNIIFNKNDDLITWYNWDSLVYVSKDEGISWDIQFVTKGKISNIKQASKSILFMESFYIFPDFTREYYLYSTQNGGESWELVLKSNSPFLNANSITVDHNGFPVRYSSSEGHVFVSYDLGRSWVKDTRFANFKINSLQFADNQLVVINGRHLTDYGSFILDSTGVINKIPDPVSSSLSAYSNFFIGKNNLCALAPLEGVFMSEDLGKNWSNISSGINLDTSNRYAAIISFTLNQQNTAFLSLEYDGIYKTKSAIVNSSNPAKTNFKIFPTLAKSSVFVEISSNLGDEHFYEILDITGNPLIHGKFNSNNTSISVEALTAGTYIIRLHTKDHKSYYSKFIKY